MAIHRVSILGHATLPDNSGNCFFEPYSIKATNDVWRHGHWIFRNAGSAQIKLYGLFNIPKNFGSAPKIIIIWTTTATSNNTVWDFEYRAVGGNDTESLDQATPQEQLTVTDAAPSATDERLETSINLNAANLAVNDEVEFFIARDKSDAADNMAAAAQLVVLYFEYSDTL